MHFRYDLHLIVEELNVFRFKRIPKVLAKNSEKFRTLTLGKFKIQDSLEHISASMDALVQDLNQTSNFSFPILQQMERFKKIPAHQKSKALKLLKRNGVFCYEHFQSLKEMKKSRNLPSKFSSLFRLFIRNLTKNTLRKRIIPMLKRSSNHSNARMWRIT